MVSVFANETHLLPRVRAALGGVAEVTVVSGWKELAEQVRTTECSVVLLEWLDGGTGVTQLWALKERYPEHRVVLVTHWELENARRLAGLPVEEVVWVREIGDTLPGAVERVCSGNPNVVVCLGVAFQEAGHLPGALRMALAHACRSGQTIHSIADLATAVGCDRRTLWHQWRQVVGPSSGLRLQDFLHWLTLHRALGLKRPDRTWERVAEMVGVHPHTLGRWARRFTGRSLSELAAGSAQAAITLLHEAWTPVVLRDLGITLAGERG